MTTAQVRSTFEESRPVQSGGQLMASQSPHVWKTWPEAAEAVDRLLGLAPSYRHVVADMIQAYGDSFFKRGRERVCEVLHLCGNDWDRFDEALRAYLRFGLESLRKQVKFNRTGRYAIEDFDEISRTLYQDDAAMRNAYLPALVLCFVFNPNYFEYYDFFETRYIPSLRDSQRIVEIGCGHGVYLARAMQACPASKGIGVDIAPASLETTRRILNYCGIASERTQLIHADLRQGCPLPPRTAQAVICCEVLEHLPDPAAALSEIRRIAAPGANLMLSAAIRMESVDHLHLFRSHHEVRQLIEAAGMEIQAEHAVPLVKGDLRNPLERLRMLEDPRVPVGYICHAIAV